MLFRSAELDEVLRVDLLPVLGVVDSDLGVRVEGDLLAIFEDCLKDWAKT